MLDDSVDLWRRVCVCGWVVVVVVVVVDVTKFSRMTLAEAW